MDIYKVMKRKKDVYKVQLIKIDVCVYILSDGYLFFQIHVALVVKTLF